MTVRKSAEDYLEAILILKKKKGYARSLDVARYLKVSKPSVSAAMKTLQDGGLVMMEDGKLLDLTEEGAEIAEKVYAKHCVLTELLCAVGVSAEQAETDACEIEHVISDETFDRLKACMEEHFHQ